MGYLGHMALTNHGTNTSDYYHSRIILGFPKFGECNTFQLMSSKKTLSRAFPPAPSYFS